MTSPSDYLRAKRLPSHSAYHLICEFIPTIGLKSIVKYIAKNYSAYIDYGLTFKQIAQIVKELEQLPDDGEI